MTIDPLALSSVALIPELLLATATREHAQTGRGAGNQEGNHAGNQARNATGNQAGEQAAKEDCNQAKNQAARLLDIAAIRREMVGRHKT